MKRSFMFGFLVALAGMVSAATFNLFAPATGVLIGNTNTYVTSAATFPDSVALVSGAIQLVNDTPTPGDLEFYGTNSLGILGWYAQGVNTTESITGNGTLTSPLILSGDSATPGNSKLYGTNASGVKGWYSQPSSPPVSANPSATIGLTAVNGTAATFMTSDSAPPLSQNIAPTWTNEHTFTQSTAATPSVVINSIANSPGEEIFGSSTNNESYGLYIAAGSTSTDYPLWLRNQTADATLFLVNGVGDASLNPTSGVGLTITGSTADAMDVNPGASQNGIVVTTQSASPAILAKSTGYVQVAAITSGASNYAEIYAEGTGGTTGYIGMCFGTAAGVCESNEAAGDSNFYGSGTVHISSSTGTDYITASTSGVKCPICSGTFTGTLTGMTATTTGTVTYNVFGGFVSLRANFTGTSNSTSMTMTGLPAALEPAQTQVISNVVENNGNFAFGAAQVTAGSGTMTFYSFGAGSIPSTIGFTASGTKGLGDWSLVYPLN